MKLSSLTRVLALKLSLLLALLTLLSACREEDKKGKRQGQATFGERSNQQGNRTANQGTSDPGGGTGVKGRAFETYIRDPRKLRGYEQFVRPALENYDREINKNDPPEAGEAPQTVADFFALKKWYLLPMDMDCVNKDVVGVFFAKDEIDVLACQTTAEVWVDDQKTNASGEIKNPKYKSSDRDVAKLIMHEFVVQIYTMRFEKFSVLLKKFKQLLPNNFKDHNTTDAEIDAWKPAEPKRKLNKEDYEIIRAATDFMMERGTTATYQEFEENIDKKIWDKRFTESSADYGKLTDVTAEDILNLLNANSAAGFRVSECRTADGQKFADCSLSWSVSQLNNQLAQNSVQLTFTVDARGGRKQFAMYLGRAKNSIAPMQESGRVLYQLYLLPADLDTKAVGSRMALVTLNFVANGNRLTNAGQLRFDSMAVSQSVISNIAEKNTGEVCYQPMLSRSANPWDNNFSAGLAGQNPNLASLKVELYKEPLCYSKAFIFGTR